MLNTFLEQNNPGLPVKGSMHSYTKVAVFGKHPFKSNHLKTHI